MFGFNTKITCGNIQALICKTKTKLSQTFIKLYQEFQLNFRRFFSVLFLLLLSTFIFLISLIWNFRLEKDTIYNYQKIQQKPPLNEMKEIITNSFQKSHDQSLTVTKPKKIIYYIKKALLSNSAAVQSFNLIHLCVNWSERTIMKRTKQINK